MVIASNRITAASKSVVGVDFDNTIADYGEAVRVVAVEKGLIAADACESKKRIRDRIRALPDGAVQWRRVQAEIYGPRIMEATLFPGVREFFARCHASGVSIVIISHKTRYSNLGESGHDLRDAAMTWLESHAFFGSAPFAITRSHVYFEETREAKIERIRATGCTHFIDDLPEVLSHSAFPPGVARILLGDAPGGMAASDIRTARSWQDIHELVF